MGSKRINETLSSISKYFDKITNKPKRVNTPNNVNNKNNMDEILIKNGHYIEKSTQNAERPNIIRILGPDKNHVERYIGQDGKSYGAYDLMENYVYTPLFANEKEIQANDRKLNIFDGIESLINGEEESVKFNEEPEIIRPKSIETQQPLPQQKIIEQKVQYSCAEAIQKTNIDYLNEKSMQKLGIEKFHKEQLTLPITIDFNYNTEKLRQIVDLLELDKNEVLDYLIDQINFDITYLLKVKLNQMVFSPIAIENNNPEFSVEMTKHAYKEVNIPILEYIEKAKTTTNNPIVVPNNLEQVPATDTALHLKQEIAPSIDEEINEIDKYIQNLITNK